MAGGRGVNPFMPARRGQWVQVRPQNDISQENTNIGLQNTLAIH